ncbi:MAG: hypothetical protein ACFFE3_00525 [Candidatus Thorarchaeota archaeon]
MTEESINPLSSQSIKTIGQGMQRVLREPILRVLLEQSLITEAQLETLLIDLMVEDEVGIHIPYESKASIRKKSVGKSTGVSRGAFNRTLHQSRRNVTKCIYTMLLLAYLGLFDYAIFRPFEEVASKIGDYRRIREVLSGRESLSTEDVESFKAAEQSIMDALSTMASPLILKSELSKKRMSSEEK